MNVAPGSPLHKLFIFASMILFVVCAAIGAGLHAMKGLLWLRSLAG